MKFQDNQLIFKILSCGLEVKENKDVGDVIQEVFDFMIKEKFFFWYWKEVVEKWRKVFYEIFKENEKYYKDIK